MKPLNNKLGLSLRQVLETLDSLAPLHRAAEWDNTGLLLKPCIKQRIRKVLLTIDLTPSVADETIALKSDMVIAYHPPLFTPVKKLTVDDPLTAGLLRLAEKHIAVYSPHTALDAAPGGVNDWLGSGLAGQEPHDIIEDDFSGRLIRFKRPVPLRVLVTRMKSFLRVKTLRVAWGPRLAGTRIRSVAVCAGSGISVLSSLEADVWVTGEMKHHDVLAACASGRSVLLAEHTRTERGYLPVYKRSIEAATQRAVTVSVAKSDTCPLLYE